MINLGQNPVEIEIFSRNNWVFKNAKLPIHDINYNLKDF